MIKFDNWILLKDYKPDVGKEIEYTDCYGDNGFAYLCKCGNCWRDPISGGGLMIIVDKWRYAENV